MNLDELRGELRQQADEVDRALPIPLPGIRRRSTNLKRRRVAAAVAGVAAATALVIGFLPAVIHTSTPDPAAPHDYVKNGITVAAGEGPDELAEAWVGDPGRPTLDAVWKPTTKNVTFRLFCRPSTGSAKTVRVSVNQRLVAERPCDDTGNRPIYASSAAPDDVLWLDAPIGESAKVNLVVLDGTGELAADPAVQVALGIYTTPQTGPPASEPGDFVKAGIRYAAGFGKDGRTAVTVGEPGQSRLTLRFTSAGGVLDLRPFCPANNQGDDDQRFALVTRVNDDPEVHRTCSSTSTDAGNGSTPSLTRKTAPGEVIVATLTLVDSKGRPTVAPGVRLGLGAYLEN